MGASSRTTREWALLAVGVSLLAFGGQLLARSVTSPDGLDATVAIALVLAAASQLLTATRLRSPRGAIAALWVVAAVLLVLRAPPPDEVEVVLGGALVAGGLVELLAVARPGRPPERPTRPVDGVLHLLAGSALLLWPSAAIYVPASVLLAWVLVLGARVVARGLDGGSRVAHAWAGLAMLAVVATFALVAVFAGVDTTPDPGPFYATPAEFDATRGTVLRREVVEGFVDGATTHRVLYSSPGVDGRPVVASGLVIVPDDGPVPDGGRPILAFTHGTLGTARSCAPSLLGASYAESMWGVRAMVDGGWIVAAPDYPGLGTEGPHPYLVGEVTAATTVDAVRAAIGLAGDQASTRFAVAGHSQGGHAALFTGQRAEVDAPELELVAVAAMAPASEIAALVEDNDGTPLGNLLGAYAITSWDRVFDDTDASSIVDEEALPLLRDLADTCLQVGPELLTVLSESELLQMGYLRSPIWSTEPWASRISANTPGSEPIEVPLLIVQGTGDVLIRADIQRDFVQRLCTSGGRLEYREVPGASHTSIDDQAGDDVVGWLTDRLSSPTTDDHCASG